MGKEEMQHTFRNYEELFTLGKDAGEYLKRTTKNEVGTRQPWPAVTMVNFQRKIVE